MYNLKPIFVVCALSIILISCGDNNEKKLEKETLTTTEETQAKKDTVKQMNLLDEQAKMLGKVFGMSDSEEGDKWKKVDNFLDLIDQADFPPDIKKHLQEQYELIDMGLDPKKKDSLKLVFNKKLNEAMAKSMAEQN